MSGPGEEGEEEGEAGAVRLVEQAGGHRTIYRLYHNFVCKTFSQREDNFYHSLPAELRRFCPRYGGTITLPPASSRYLVLENLTQEFVKPCVLDLKMGTRMYSDTAAAAKVASQKRKSVRTTSASLGVRFCGSYKYNCGSNSYTKVDKYTGRRADLLELTQLVREFFSVSGGLRLDVLDYVISQLADIKKVLTKLDGFRFYSSSLLIIYDGLKVNSRSFLKTQSEPTKPFKVKVRIIDFANAAVPGDCSGVSHSGADQGFLLGLRSIKKILEVLKLCP